MPSEQSSEEKQTTAEQRFRRCYLASQWALVLITTVGIIIALCTLSNLSNNVTAANKQARAEASAAATAQKQLQLSERAYVSLGNKEGITMKLMPLIVGKPITIAVYIQNSGHLPAPFVVLNADVQPSFKKGTRIGGGPMSFHHITSCIPSKLFESGIGTRNAPIPAESTQVRYLDHNRNLSAADIKSFEANGWDVGVIGTVEYCDGLNKIHCLSLCESYRPAPVNDFTPCLGGNVDYCWGGPKPPQLLGPAAPGDQAD